MGKNQYYINISTETVDNSYDLAGCQSWMIIKYPSLIFLNEWDVRMGVIYPTVIKKLEDIE